MTHAPIQRMSVTVRTPNFSGVIYAAAMLTSIHNQAITYSSIQELNKSSNGFMKLVISHMECGYT